MAIVTKLYKTRLTKTHVIHAALLVIKLLALNPIAAMTWVNRGILAYTDVIRACIYTI